MTDYPRPKVPVQQVLSSVDFIPNLGACSFKSIAQVKNVQYITSGRAGIALALQHANIQAPDKVLVPAYHCSSMVDPVLYSGAEPVFYKIHQNTTIDLDDIKSKLNKNTKLLMVTHYFGFPQDMPTIRKFCDENNILLLEDCAHSFFGQFNGHA